jgi:hypothetical protein
MLFENFPDNSRVWIYAADRFLTTEEEIFVKRNIDAFVDQWAAHGSELAAAGAILNHTFIVLIADESNVAASGCSIDSSVRFIKDLGKELNIDFLNRLSIVIEKEGEFKHIHFNDLSSCPDWNMFDATVKNLKEFRENWKMPIKESPFV